MELLKPVAFGHASDSVDLFTPNETLSIFRFIAQKRPGSANGRPYSVVFFVQRQDRSIGGLSMTTRGDGWVPQLIIHGSFLDQGTHVVVRDSKDIHDSDVFHD